MKFTAAANIIAKNDLFVAICSFVFGYNTATAENSQYNVRLHLLCFLYYT